MAADETVAVALTGELRARCGRQCLLSVGPVRLSGGYSSDLFEFVLSNPPTGLEGALVLRLQPGQHALREQVVHEAAAAAAYATPQPILWGGADSHFERPYTIMRRLDGGPAVRLDGIGALKALRQAPILVADAMARLHELDPKPALEELEARGIGTAELGVNGAFDEIERADVGNVASQAVDVLRRHEPDPSPPVLVHGDLHALNLWRQPDHTVSVLDWELATIGPPEHDVARTALMFSLVPGEIPGAVRPLLMRLGQRADRSFREHYAKDRPLDQAALPWYCALHALRLITTVVHRRQPDSVTAQWRPVSSYLAATVESVTAVRLPVSPHP